MARSADQIERDYALSIETSDPSWDTTQGPIRELFTVPLSGITAKTEEDAENLRKLFSLNFDETITQEEMAQALNNYGSRPGAGTRSAHNQYFLRFTRPRENIIIPVGTLVSNSAGNLMYRTTVQITMIYLQADSYYNPTRKAYEISVPVEADGVGAEYTLPAYRVQTILTPVNGIDATENRERSSQGLPTEDITKQSNRLRTTLLGLNINTQGGISKRIKDALSNSVSSVQVITPSDPEFKRVQTKPSIDVYILGTFSQSVTENITATANQTQIVPLKQPLIGVTSVILNGTTNLGFTLVQDESNDTGRSTKSNDTIELSVPLSLNDMVEYTYVYNKVLDDVQTIVFNDASESLFQTDYLIREFRRSSPLINMELKTLTSYSFEEVAKAVREKIRETLDDTVFRERLSPSEMRDLISGSVSGIQYLRITRFRRDIGSVSNLETIVFALNEMPQYKDANIDIKAAK